MPAPVARLVVIQVDADTVLCSGLFASANGAGLQSMVQPRLFRNALTPLPGATPIDPLAGDVVVQMDDGTYQHQPVPRADAPAPT